MIDLKMKKVKLVEVINTEKTEKEIPVSMSRCWLFPLAGALLTFLTSFTFNYLNFSFRENWETIGTVMYAISIFLGIYFLIKNAVAYKSYKNFAILLHITAGVAVNSGLALMLFINSLALYYFNASSENYQNGYHPVQVEKYRLQKPYYGQQTGKLDIWLDLDPTSYSGALENVDSSWALVAALRSQNLNIRGISTVFNQDQYPAQTAQAAGVLVKEVIARLSKTGDTVSQAGSTVTMTPVNETDAEPQGFTELPVYDGSLQPGTPYWPMTPASTALARILHERSLTILAFGPLTNVATVLKHHPEMARKIERIILLAGKNPDDVLLPGKQWWYHSRQFVISRDTVAANIILYSGIPLILIPFELTTKLMITADEIEALKQGDPTAQWLSQKSLTWLSYWQNALHKEGFYAFQLLAVGYTIMPELFAYKVLSTRIGFNLLLEPFGIGRDLEVATNLRGPQVIYCYDIARELKPQLVNLLKGVKVGDKP